MRLWHNCAINPVFVVKTDFIDSLRLLILRNLLKTKSCRKIPSYQNSGYRFVSISI